MITDNQSIMGYCDSCVEPLLSAEETSPLWDYILRDVANAGIASESVVGDNEKKKRTNKAPRSCQRQSIVSGIRNASELYLRAVITSYAGLCSAASCWNTNINKDWVCGAIVVHRGRSHLRVRRGRLSMTRFWGLLVERG